MPSIPEQPVAPPPLVNLANALTVARLILVPVFIVLFVHNSATSPGWRLASTVVFLVAALTDLYDGRLARKLGVVTDFGKLADPIADKALVASALICLSWYGLVSWWVTGIILGRELAVTLMRMAVVKYQVIPASWGGKVKTATQLSAIVGYLLPGEWINRQGWLATLIALLMILAVAATVATGFDYALTAWGILRRAKADGSAEPAGDGALPASVAASDSKAASAATATTKPPAADAVVSHAKPPAPSDSVGLATKSPAADAVTAAAKAPAAAKSRAVDAVASAAKAPAAAVGAKSPAAPDAVTAAAKTPASAAPKPKGRLMRKKTAVTATTSQPETAAALAATGEQPAPAAPRPRVRFKPVPTSIGAQSGESASATSEDAPVDTGVQKAAKPAPAVPPAKPVRPAAPVAPAPRLATRPSVAPPTPSARPQPAPVSESVKPARSVEGWPDADVKPARPSSSRPAPARPVRTPEWGQLHTVQRSTSAPPAPTPASVVPAQPTSGKPAPRKAGPVPGRASTPASSAGAQAAAGRPAVSAGTVAPASAAGRTPAPASSARAQAASGRPAASQPPLGAAPDSGRTRPTAAPAKKPEPRRTAEASPQPGGPRPAAVGARPDTAKRAAELGGDKTASADSTLAAAQAAAEARLAELKRRIGWSAPPEAGGKGEE
ncbi:MAG: CDP-diacylglycerol--glycerol-3-phosphate 3-phosphatidyltransferase [Bifidobacteriaceae bacterium]|nr:CDP-diacylglycerol--glycerol-3-phosphate 3-phosphatidyltransferase [Bifidobacteriaceae bacterium]